MIESGSRVSLEYVLTLDDESVADTNVGSDPLVYVHGTDQLLPALEDALSGQATGDTLEVSLTTEQAYGPVNPDAFQEVPLTTVPENARTVGAILATTDPQGRTRPVRVHEVRETTIVLDFNHPLAGQALTFALKILAVE